MTGASRWQSGFEYLFDPRVVEAFKRVVSGRLEKEKRRFRDNKERNRDHQNASY